MNSAQNSGPLAGRPGCPQTAGRWARGAWIRGNSWHLPHPGPSSHWTLRPGSLRALLHPEEGVLLSPHPPRCPSGAWTEKGAGVGPRPLDNGNAGDSPSPARSHPLHFLSPCSTSKALTAQLQNDVRGQWPREQQGRRAAAGLAPRPRGLSFPVHPQTTSNPLPGRSSCLHDRFRGGCQDRPLSGSVTGFITSREDTSRAAHSTPGHSFSCFGTERQRRPPGIQGVPGTEERSHNSFPVD